MSSYKDGEEWFEPVFNIHTPLPPTLAPILYLSLLNAVTTKNVLIYKKYWKAIFRPPLFTPRYACASRRFAIHKHDLQQITLTEAEVDASVSNYARNFLRCIYV